MTAGARRAVPLEQGADMNLPAMRAIVRRDLHDEDFENYRWSDDELDRHIARALAQFSLALPVEDTEDIETTDGSREIDISQLSDRVMVQAVEYPTGSYPRSYQRFALWGDKLTILSDRVVSLSPHSAKR